jgi:hypothetical protein
MASYVLGLRNAQLDALTTYVGPNAKLRIYSGTRPNTGAVLNGSNVLLAEFLLGEPFASGALNGVLNPTMPAAVNGLATGTATWFRVIREDQSTICIDGSISTSSADLVLDSTSIVTGTPVQINSWTITRSNT